MRILLRTTFQYFSRNKWLSLITVTVMTLSFFVTSLFTTAAYGSHLLLDFFESKAQVVAFFKDEATEGQILGVKTSLEVTGKVAEVRYTSKEEALKIYMGRFKEDPALLESIAANILPASLDIMARNIEDLPEIAAFLEKEPLVEDVRFYKDIVERLRTLTNGARLVGATLVAVLTTISIFIVLTTIGMTIHDKRQEIEVMKLVGATNWYIRWPFVLQGAIYGCAAAVFSSLLLLIILPKGIPYLEATFLGNISLNLFNTQFLITLFSSQFVLGVFLGAMGSFAAVWRSLK